MLQETQGQIAVHGRPAAHPATIPGSVTGQGSVRQGTGFRHGPDQVEPPEPGEIKKAVCRQHEGPVRSEKILNQTQDAFTHLVRWPAEPPGKGPKPGINRDNLIILGKQRLQDLGKVVLRQLCHIVDP